MVKKKVLITGGNGDIAKAISAKLLETEKYEVNSPGKEKLDVISLDSVSNYFLHYVPDILINNAGFIIPQSIKNCNRLIERQSIDINLWGTFNCTAATLEKNPAAQIINIGSSAATKVHSTWSSYCATKAAVVMATKCWADDGINAVCISPGRTATKMRKALYQDEDQQTLLKPEEFATIVLYAIEGRYASGMHINVTRQNVQQLIMEEDVF